MNIMYDDRQFLLISGYGAAARDCLSLVDRIVLANDQRNYPYDLPFLDKRTVEESRNRIDGLNWRKLTSRKAGYAFYMPNESCPLDYYDLAIWFSLVSTAQARSTRKFQQSIIGLDVSLGINRKTIAEHIPNLEAKTLIVHEAPSNPRIWSWWFVNRWEDYAEWFLPVTNTVPDRIAEAERKMNEMVQALRSQNKDKEPVAITPIEDTIPPTLTKEQRYEQILLQHGQDLPDFIRDDPEERNVWARFYHQWGAQSAETYVQRVANAKGISYKPAEPKSAEPAPASREEAESSSDEPGAPDDDFLRRLQDMG